MSDDERRNKSWREIDRQKDSSKHTSRDRKSRKSQDKRSSAKYKRDLDKLFKSGEMPERFKEMMKGLEPEEGTPEAERKAAIDELRKADGFREFATAVSEYRKAGWTYPDDEDLLIRMLDHPDERVVRDALEHVADLAGRRGFDRVTPLKNRLSTIKTMSDDPRTRKAVAQVEEAIE
ncbi:hypothetical protein FIV42_08230 [Persicimonas caeni]|uniref:HEAT repeat domain-containing protein n=1 Tax=Persicimonas caeni TaxID=2292766 RepID=A0A4Y6PQX3_PERCE|nr:hypothetical protein [Persicimonas caeni]QDG50716.1 hypothetical protein FIV42_08230 [Persicimonas caeni]QED31937.1 hypothetical protein FRD00_08225 [Persicimonas caeni]